MGEFEYVETLSDEGIICRAYSRVGTKEQAKWNSLGYEKSWYNGNGILILQWII